MKICTYDVALYVSVRTTRDSSGLIFSGSSGAVVWLLSNEKIV